MAGLKVFEDGACVTQRPASIFFVTVLTMIESAGEKIQFYQSFRLPQSDTDHLCDGAVHTTSGYGGEDTMLMDESALMEEIVGVGSLYEPCILLGCDFTGKDSVLPIIQTSPK